MGWVRGGKGEEEGDGGREEMDEGKGGGLKISATKSGL